MIAAFARSRDTATSPVASASAGSHQAKSLCNVTSSSAPGASRSWRRGCSSAAGAGGEKGRGGGVLVGCRRGRGVRHAEDVPLLGVQQPLERTAEVAADVGG